MTIEEQQIEVDGLLTHYLAAGEGPPLLLLHALGESALDWRWVLPDLARTHRDYAPDLPGFGDSAKPTADYSPIFFEGFVARFSAPSKSSAPPWLATRSVASLPCAWPCPNRRGRAPWP